MKKYTLIIVAIFAVSVFLMGCGEKTTVYPPQGDPVEPSPEPETTVPAPADDADDDVPTTKPELQNGGLEEASLPELKDCETDYALGWVPNSCNLQGDNFKITLKAVGDGGIDGIVFYVVGPTEIQKTLKDSTKVASGDEQAYEFSLSELADEVGGEVSKIFALPIKEVSGEEYACFNQRLLVIKDSACRG